MLENGSILKADGRQYQILEMLGRGANTIAYLAHCHSGELKYKCILKEYAPQNNDDFDTGKQRFIEGGKTQNKIRQLSALNNQTPPVFHIFETNGTAYIDVACYNGTTLDKLYSLSLPQYMALCETISKTVGYYHKSGYLCLDLKPENIFVLQNTPEDTITQLVEFIDFDSIHDLNNADSKAFSYTRDWAAPEQLDPYQFGKIGKSSDIYTVGELVFFLIFGRHSADNEHRGFSRYQFEKCKREYLRYIDRPDIQALFTKLFRGTLRSSAANRFKSIDEVTAILGKLVSELDRKDYIIPVLPAVSPDFVGRDAELKTIAEKLNDGRVLYITGVGGIGKSTLVRKYISIHKTEYDAIVYLEYDGDFVHTFCDDMQLQINTVSRQDNESLSDYFARKLKALKSICTDKRVLFIVDDFSGMVGKELSRIINSGYDTLIVTRNKPPKNSFAVMEVNALTNKSELFKLIKLNIDRQLTKSEQSCFEEIISLVQGHILVLELIARQIAAGRLDVHRALELIRENGFSRFSGEKIGNYKDGEEVYDTLSAIISALFDAGTVSEYARLTLKTLALLNVRGLETDLVQKFFPDIQPEIVKKLSSEGWLYDDERIRLHPVIAETVRSWEWNTDDVSVMDIHKKMADIYAGMSNSMQLREIVREADIFRSQHNRHIIRAMYLDIQGFYYDTLLGGAYYPENDEEAELLEKLTENMSYAISELKLSDDSRSSKYLSQYCLSLAGILLRSSPDTESFAEASELLDMAKEYIEENSTDHCYYCMVSAWYYTLAEPDKEKTKEFTERAEKIAEKVYPTKLEIIDIIHIPTANCWFYHGELKTAARKIEEAVDICRGYPDSLPYIDKRAELLNCMLDVYYEMKDKPRCRELIKEIDKINETYKEQGINREVAPEIREKAGS